jgi:hypothetical protein
MANQQKPIIYLEPCLVKYPAKRVSTQACSVTIRLTMMLTVVFSATPRHHQIASFYVPTGAEEIAVF